jgi:polysaccharide export outer membrane protein
MSDRLTLACRLPDTLKAFVVLLLPFCLAFSSSLAAARDGWSQTASTSAQPLEQTPAGGLTPGTAPGQPPASYVIGPQDVLKISVVDEGPELQNQTAIVGSDGTISFWALKNIVAGGKTLRVLQDQIAALLADGYIKNPVVRAEIEKYKSQYVTVIGEVRTPSRIPMMASKSLLEALADSGGQSGPAANEAEVSHTSGLKEMIDLRDVQAAQAYMLKDGDVVLVPKVQAFYINGEVRNQGALVWQRSMTLSQAVTLAGGLTDRGTYRNAEATRITKGKTAVVKLSEQSPILPEDVITINHRIF